MDKVVGEVDVDVAKVYPGPVLVLAGPGTGKTYQLANRIKFLVEKKEARPDEIAVITFTVEAARNMRERLTHEDINLPKEKHPEIISTMHSLGNKIIGTSPETFDLTENYGLLNQRAKQIVLLQDAANLAGFERDEYNLAANCRRLGDCSEDESEDKCKICKQYKMIIRKCALVDYDDQIMLACNLLKDNEELRTEWKRKTKYLLVDEYQDINQAQCELIQLLTEGQPEGLFVVGDDDQSIYSFRGGDPKYICNFEDYYGNKAKTGRLSMSWRCSEHILLGARSMATSFYKNSSHKPEPKFSETIETNNKITFYDVPSADYEAWLITEIVKEKAKANSIIIIIPNIKYLPLLKQKLTEAGLEYKYKTKLSDDGLQRFVVLADYIDNIGDNSTLRYLIELIINNYDELLSEFECEGNGIKIKRIKASMFISNLWNNVNTNTSLYEAIKQRCNNGNSFLVELIKNIEEIYCLLKEQGTTRNAMEPFLQKCGLLLAPDKNPKGMINEVLEWKHELLGSNRVSSLEPINIYNIQSSKGLEADIVFVVGLSEGLFPGPRDDPEEKSRLFYVAMTRAIKELYLFSARTRSGATTFGKSYQLKKSPFIDKIPKKHIDSKYLQLSKSD